MSGRKVAPLGSAACQPLELQTKSSREHFNLNVMTFDQTSHEWQAALPEDSHLPLWVQISQRLREAIDAGVFPPNSVLPSEAELNRLFGVSRATSRSVLNELERQGLIVRRAGKGSIVLRPRLDQPAEVMAGFSEDMRRRGRSPSYRTLEAGKVPVDTEVAEALEIRSETRVFRSRRVLLADGEPMGLAISWIPPRLLKGLSAPTPEELTQGSLYAWMFRHCGTRFIRAREYIEAAAAEPDLAALLEVSCGAPLLVARRQSFDESGKPAEYSVLHFRSDRYRFQLEVSHKVAAQGTAAEGSSGTSF